MAIDKSNIDNLEKALKVYNTDALGLLEIGKKAEKLAKNRDQLRVAKYFQVLAKKRIEGAI